MSEVEVNVVEEDVEQEEYSPFVQTARKVLLAGIGAVALAQDEVEDFVNRLVERGEIAEKDGRELIKDVMERRKEKATEARQGVSGEVEKRFEQLMHRMNVPTKDDVDALNRKIATLNEKIDELQSSS